jgi:serine/threonine protein kinase/tetratricopeptide (TPR) repeat protein
LRADDRALADLAASVADGSPVDWQAAEAGAAARDRRLVRHLRLVDSIAALHRSIPIIPADVETPGVAPAVRDGHRWGRLVLLERIGKGTSCEVFRAWDSELHRDVALKLFLKDRHVIGEANASVISETNASVIEEARRLARLRHEHIVQVYGAEEHDGREGLWTELVRGESLDEIVQARGPLGAREAALVGLDVCAALAAVHNGGLLHRDVKAQNVMRESGGRIVLMDFGTGEELGGTSRLVGTPLYLAPEIFRGQKASVQSDVYSVGVLLYYLVTGAFPVAAATMEQLERAHANHHRRPLRDLRPDVPEGFVRVVERALDSDPLRRYRSVGELEHGLRESLEKPVAVAESGPAVTSRAPRRFGPAFLAAAAALALLVVALIVWSRSSTPVTTPVTRVAVLPFRDISNDPAAHYLADELTDQLISTLGQIGSLQVPSLTSVSRFRDSSVSLVEIGKQLNVDDIIEATLLVVRGKDGTPDRVRVNARLIAAGSDSQIWAQQFEASMGDTLALQADVARAIAEGIRAVVTPAERRRLTQVRPTTPAANEAYYQGLHYLSQSSADGHRAVDAFRRATALDPDHAGAHAGLARGLVTLGFLGATTHQEGRALALAEVNRALALDPDSSEAHAVLADLQFYYDWDWAGADRAYRRSIALNGSFARARSQYARYLAAARRGDESIAEANRAADLDPMSASAVSTRALILYYARDYQAALDAIGHALQLEPGSASAYFMLSRIDAARGAINEALAANERALAIAGDNSSNSWRVHRLRLQALSGLRDEAKAGLVRIPAEAASRHQRVGFAQLASVHEALGDRVRALDLLEKAVSEREPDLLWLAVDPRVDSLRSEPRFEQVLARLGIPK